MRTLALTYDTDKEMIDEFLATGSERSATAFVRLYQNFVFATALRYTQNYDDADDITQEVFIKALNGLKNFRRDSSLKTWLYRIAVNLSLNHTRKKKIFTFFGSSDDKEGYLNIADEHQRTDSGIENEEFEKMFRKVLSELPEKQRETFALRYFEEMPYEEISKMLGTSVGGLKANYFQAVKKLGTYLKKYKLIED